MKTINSLMTTTRTFMLVSALAATGGSLGCVDVGEDVEGEGEQAAEATAQPGWLSVRCASPRNGSRFESYNFDAQLNQATKRAEFELRTTTVTAGASTFRQRNGNLVIPVAATNTTVQIGAAIFDSLEPVAGLINAEPIVCSTTVLHANSRFAGDAFASVNAPLQTNTATHKAKTWTSSDRRFSFEAHWFERSNGTQNYPGGDIEHTLLEVQFAGRATDLTGSVHTQTFTNRADMAQLKNLFGTARSLTLPAPVNNTHRRQFLLDCAARSCTVTAHRR